MRTSLLSSQLRNHATDLAHSPFTRHLQHHPSQHVYPEIQVLSNPTGSRTMWANASRPSYVSRGFRSGVRHLISFECVHLDTRHARKFQFSQPFCYLSNSPTNLCDTQFSSPVETNRFTRLSWSHCRGEKCRSPTQTLQVEARPPSQPQPW